MELSEKTIKVEFIERIPFPACVIQIDYHIPTSTGMLTIPPSPNNVCNSMYVCIIRKLGFITNKERKNERIQTNNHNKFAFPFLQSSAHIMMVI